MGEQEGGAAEAVAVGDPYAEEPERHPALLVRSQKPFNAETPRVLLGEQENTPSELFYVRHHLPVPRIAAEEYRLQVEGAPLPPQSPPGASSPLWLAPTACSLRHSGRCLCLVLATYADSQHTGRAKIHQWRMQYCGEHCNHGKVAASPRVPQAKGWTASHRALLQRRLMRIKQGGCIGSLTASSPRCGRCIATSVPRVHAVTREARWWTAGEGVRAVTLTLEDLKTKFRRHTVAAAMQCTGNRRHELKMVKNMPVSGRRPR